MNMNPKTKKWLIAIGVIIILRIIVGFFPDDKDKANEVVAKEQPEEVNKTIPGANPVDIYLDLENKGYKIDKQHSSEYGNLWTCTLKEYAIEYNVQISGADASTVESVRATASITGAERKTVEALKPFISYISTMPYDGNDVILVKKWLNDNFNKDGASIIIGKVKFTIYGKTPFVRSLMIEKA